MRTPTKNKSVWREWNEDKGELREARVWFRRSNQGGKRAATTVTLRGFCSLELFSICSVLQDVKIRFSTMPPSFPPFSSRASPNEWSQQCKMEESRYAGKSRIAIRIVLFCFFSPCNTIISCDVLDLLQPLWATADVYRSVCNPLKNALFV